jgi:hypothetical protein
MTEARETVAIIMTFIKCNKNALERWAGASRKINTLYNRFFQLTQHIFSRNKTTRFGYKRRAIVETEL